jgi:hypothetical protein
MGRWGPTAFEDDGALDYLAEVIDKLVDVNEEILRDRYRFALDEDGSAVFMPNVELMCIICEQLPIATPPGAQVVRRWREQYLAMFDDQIEDLQPREGFAAEYRSAIEQSLLRLERLAEHRHRRVDRPGVI